MIDNIRIKIKDKNSFENYLLENEITDFQNFFNITTGEMIEYPKMGKEENLDIRITKEGSFIFGSLHKFENLSFEGINHNANPFTFYQLECLIPYLIEKFNLKNNHKITAFEFGFNIPIDRDPEIIVAQNILMYDFKSPNRDLKYKGKGDFKEFQKSDYSLKIYNKSKQYKLESHILRIELKITTTRKVQELGIFSLEDFLNKTTMINLFGALYKEFDKVLIVDQFDSSKFNEGDTQKLNKYTNPNFWFRVNQEKSYKVRNRMRREFFQLLEENNLFKTKAYLTQGLLSVFEHDMEYHQKDQEYDLRKEMQKVLVSTN